MDRFSRRRVLRGMVGGSAVSVGIPLLNYFLNTNGTALANGFGGPIGGQGKASAAALRA